MKTNVICDFFKNYTRVIETKKKGMQVLLKNSTKNFY